MLGDVLIDTPSDLSVGSMNNFELHHGDCLELLNDVENKSIDLVCCDMPYGTTNCRWDTVIDLDRLWEHYERIIKDNGAIVLFAQTPFDKVLGASNLKLLRYEIIWEKTKATGFLNAKRMPLKAHENILVFYKRLPTYNPQKTKGKPYNKGLRKDQKTDDIYQNYKQVEVKSDGERYPRSVLKFKTAENEGALHPTQKPIALIEWIVKTYSNEGDTVLDNCMGSGTAAEACLNLDRGFIGMENEQKYYDISKERISNALQQRHGL